jgi:hypothetical protein
MLPSQFVNLDINEKAFVIAVIQQKVESDKKQKEKLEKGR